MLLTLAKALAIIIPVCLMWVAVDLMWRRTFQSRAKSRPTCGGCVSCENQCAKND